MFPWLVAARAGNYDSRRAGPAPFMALRVIHRLH